MRTETETYTRNRYYCDGCKRPDKQVRIYKFISGIQIALCDDCRKKKTTQTGFCDFCRKPEKKIHIYKVHSLKVALCESCLSIQAPQPRKKKAPDAYKNEVLGNEAMTLIQRGLADAKAGRTSKVEL